MLSYYYIQIERTIIFIVKDDFGEKKNSLSSLESLAIQDGDEFLSS